MNGLDSRVSLAILRTWSRYVSESRWPFLALEWTAHGVPWLIGAAVTFGMVCRRSDYSAETKRKFALLTLGILFDLATVGIFKLAVRRQRPPYNRDDQIYEAPVADQFSFPSGHTSRAAMLAVFAVEFFPVRRFLGRLFVFTLPVLLGISRVAMGRHYFSDVIAGLALGALEGLAILEIPELPLDESIKFLSGASSTP